MPTLFAFCGACKKLTDRHGRWNGLWLIAREMHPARIGVWVEPQADAGIVFPAGEIGGGYVTLAISDHPRGRNARLR
jgi:hypothetical protein